MGITHNPAAQSLAIRQSVAKGPAWYAWRDHFLLVDPHSNPVRLNKTDDILTMFSSLYTAAKNGGAPVGTRFLSRYDKSATNIKESDLWIGIGQVRCSSPAVVAPMLISQLLGSMDDDILHVVPSVHRLFCSGADRRQPSGGVHRYGLRHLTHNLRGSVEPDGHL